MVCGKAREVMSCFSEIFPFCSLLLWPLPSRCKRCMHEAKRDFPLPFRDVRSWAELFASMCHSSNLTPSLGGLTKSRGVNSPLISGCWSRRKLARLLVWRLVPCCPMCRALAAPLGRKGCSQHSAGRETLLLSLPSPAAALGSLWES